MTQHFLSLYDLTPETLMAVLDRADALKKHRATSTARPLSGKSIALIFEKPSTRTRVSFEVAVRELGAHPVVLSSRDMQLGRGEGVEDTARVLSGYVHAIVIRTFSTDALRRMAAASSVPVINALTDEGHPCQILADLQAVREHKGALKGLKYVWVGDGNNVARSWMEAARMLELQLTLACPAGYEPPPESVPEGVRVLRDPVEAARGADVFITDVWTSMGQEAQNAERLRVFEGYQVNRALVDHGAPGAIVLHCLPAHRGEEITAEFVDPPESPVWTAAENRLHAQKALLEHLLVG